jgi:hypothetical protein
VTALVLRPAAVADLTDAHPHYHGLVDGPLATAMSAARSCRSAERISNPGSQSGRSEGVRGMPLTATLVWS